MTDDIIYIYIDRQTDKEIIYFFLVHPTIFTPGWPAQT